MEEFIEAMKNDHRDFDHANLEGFFGHEPFDLFAQWFKEAADSKQPEANAFTLSTVDSEGQTHSRILYMKDVIEKNFVFYTNYHSAKGRDLEHNNKASMLFFWPGLQRQIRIEGACSKVPQAMSDEYFASRPRGSKVGAWASNQSEILQSREDLEKRVIEFAEKFVGEVPRPPHWGGYALKPSKVEFWQGRPSRLHDRIVYEWKMNDWTIYRINP